jgi:ABC-2 type transport system ATP-binding protein
MVSTNEAVVQTFSVTKVFRDFWRREKVAAVCELDLEILPNEVFGLLGPNGSGKSTTIKMILGLLYPTRGYIRVFGRRPTNVAVKSRIGFLPEESYLYPFLNARETLDYYGRLFRLPRPERRRRVEMLLDMVGLTKVAYRRVGEYSKGMQRRIGLAQALINDPDLLILDEPTSGLDPLGTRQFKDIIHQLRRRGKTVVLSSHLLGDVEDVCDRVAILYGGRLRAQGGVDELLSRNDMTQITTARLKPSTLEKIRQLLAEDGPAEDVRFSAPRERLETLFLRVVETAQSQRLATGGAVGTGEVAAFLRGEGEGDGRQVVERMVAAAEEGRPRPTGAEMAAAAASAGAKARVLDELAAAGVPPSSDETPADRPSSGEAPPGSAAGASTAAPARPVPRPQADRSVIDSLTNPGSSAGGKDSHA